MFWEAMSLEERVNMDACGRLIAGVEDALHCRDAHAAVGSGRKVNDLKMTVFIQSTDKLIAGRLMAIWQEIRNFTNTNITNDILIHNWTSKNICSIRYTQYV